MYSCEKRIFIYLPHKSGRSELYWTCYSRLDMGNIFYLVGGGLYYQFAYHVRLDHNTLYKEISQEDLKKARLVGSFNFLRGAD